RVTNGKPCYTDWHWKRLAHSAEALSIPFDLSFAEWEVHLMEQIKRDNLYNGGIKAILSGGSAPRGLAEQGQISQLMLQTFNYTVRNHPVLLLSATWLREGANPVYQFKSVNYLEAILARRIALASGADDALFFNTQGHATETTCANLFILKNRELLTPPLSDGVLPGITRSRIRGFCDQGAYGFREQSITQSLLAEADAVFITNSLQGIRMVQSLDDTIFNCDHSGMEPLLSAHEFYYTK
ncbi:MAG: aminotransferase class IV, partial [Legionellales bacterium]